MDTYSKVLSKSSVSWTDVLKNLKVAIQGRNFSVNKILIKQCTDLLVKHIKNLNQNQVSEQLESLSQSGQLGFSKISKDNTNNCYLHSDDFYFEVPINFNGEIGDVKFAMFHESPQSSTLLKNIFCTWNWDLLITNIDGIKSLYILADQDRSIRENAYKALKFLENDLIVINNLNKQFYKNVDKIIQESAIGLFKKSDIGHPMRLYYYLSPQDLIWYGNSLIENISEEMVLKYELGSYLTISLQKLPSKLSKLPDCSLLRTEQNIENKLLFDTNKQYKGYEVPGTFLISLNRPIVMCIDTLQELESLIGMKIIDVEDDKNTCAYFEALCKTIHGKYSSDSFQVQLPNETHIYYITESKDYLAVEISKIPFTHPSHIQAVIGILRKQLLLNELSLSCMRKTCYSSGFKNARILEISLISNFNISVIMQHPNLPCYTTIEIDVNNGCIRTKFRDHSNLHDPNIINEVFHRCHSIPVTMRALLMKYKRTNLMLVDGKNENGNASIQQQVYGATNELFNNNLTPSKHNLNFSKSSSNQFETQKMQERNKSSTFKENENISNVSKFENTDDLEIYTANSEENLKSKFIENSEKHILNVKKRKAQSNAQDITGGGGGGLPFAKKKIVNSNELNDEFKHKKQIGDSKSLEFKSDSFLHNNINNKSPKMSTSSQELLIKNVNIKQESTNLDFKKKSKNSNLTKPSNNKIPHSLSFNNPQKQNLTNNQSILTKTPDGLNLPTKDKNLKDKMLLGKTMGKDLSNKKLNIDSNSIKKNDLNFSNVNMKIKPITKDGLKIRISKETTKLSQNSTTLLNSLNLHENPKNQLNSINYNTQSENVALISNGSNTSTLPFSKQLSFNESISDKSTVDITLPKYEPKSKMEKKSNTQFKRSISSAPTTPSYIDNTNNLMNSLSNSLLKNKSITPPSNLDLSTNSMTSVQSNKTQIKPANSLPTNILPIKNNSIKSNFKIPKSKTNITPETPTEQTSSTLNNQISLLQRNSPLPQQSSNLNTKKTESTFEPFKSISGSTPNSNNQIAEFNSFLTPPINRYKSNDDETNQKSNKETTIVKPTTNNSLNQTSKQQVSNLNKLNNFPPKPPSKDKTPTGSNRPLTPVPTNNPTNFSQPYNRNNNSKTPLMNTDMNKNRNNILASSPINSNSSTSNFTAFSSNSHNQILLTPTSPSNNSEEILIPSKLSTIIPPDSPSNSVCEATSIPKLIPLERNNDYNSTQENSELEFQLDESIHKNSNMFNQYKCENSPEENSLIIDLVSTNSHFLTPLSDRFSEKVGSMNENTKESVQTNSPISYSKSAYPDVYDNDTENDLKVN